MFKIIKAHYRKQWISFVTVALFILISSMMLSIGITIMSESKTFFDDKAKEQNLADYQISIGNVYGKYTDFYNRFIEHLIVDDKSVDDYERTKEMGLKFYRAEDESVDYYIGARPLNEAAEISKIIPKIEFETDKPIYLNEFARLRNGIQAGDRIVLHGPKIKQEFVVAGFYEELMSMYNMYAYLKKEDFEYLYRDVLEFNIANYGEPLDYYCNDIYYIKSRDVNYINNMTIKVMEVYGAVFSGVQLHYNITSQTYAKENLGSFASILSVILVAFSFILIAISIIIIRFSLISFMEDDIKNTGILKALGYTNTDFRKIIFTEYLLIAVLAGVAGALISIALAPVFSSIIGTSIDLIWRAAPMVWVLIVSVVAPAVITAFFVWLISRKIGTITPLNALRNGIETHNFKKNRLPLFKYDKCTNLVLSLKGILNHTLRYISVGLVLVVISFLSVFVTTLHYNLNVSNTAFAGLTGAETADAVVHDGDIPKSVLEEMEEIDHISYQGYAGSVKLVAGEKKFYNHRTYVYNDYGKSSIRVLYSGRYPANANEIAVTGKVAEFFGINIGDSLSIMQKGELIEFSVVGLCQNMSFPESVYFTLDGLMRIPGNENYTPYNSYLYIKDGVNYDAFMEKLYSMAENSVNIGDRDYCAKLYITPALSEGAFLLTIAIDIITLLAVTMVLLFILRLKIIREKKSVAINKSIGSTTKQIIIQMTVGIVIVISIFAALGSLLGALLSEVILKLALSSFAIKTITLVIPSGIIAAMVIVMIAFTASVSALIALNTRRITPRSLITGA